MSRLRLRCILEFPIDCQTANEAADLKGFGLGLHFLKSSLLHLLYKLSSDLKHIWIMNFYVWLYCDFTYSILWNYFMYNSSILLIYVHSCVVKQSFSEASMSSFFCQLLGNCSAVLFLPSEITLRIRPLQGLWESEACFNIQIMMNHLRN